MTTSQPYLPKIASLFFAIEPERDVVTQWVKTCSALGFDHLLLPASSPQALVSLFGEICKKNKLALLIDLNIAKVELHDPLLQTHPDWFDQYVEYDDLPDPRRLGQKRLGQRLQYTRPHCRMEILDYWHAQLSQWKTLGVSGFRCVDLPGAPASVWQALIQQAKAVEPATRFLAWTPGCTTDEIARIVACGFDATFSSAAWWNFHARWIAEEHARLANIAPPIAFPETPDYAVLARSPGMEDPSLREAIYRRAIQLAAVVGSGWLMPLGVERGLMGGEVDEPELDLREEVIAANRFIDAYGAALYSASLDVVSAPESTATLLLRKPEPMLYAKTAKQRSALQGMLVLLNASLEREVLVQERHLLASTEGLVPGQCLLPQANNEMPHALHTIRLQPAQLLALELTSLAPVLLPAPRGKQSTVAAAKAPRIAIEAITPSVDNGRFAVKRVVGDFVTVEADVFADGHDKLAVCLLWRPADAQDWQEICMHAIGNDRWSASFPVKRLGRHYFAVEAWRDEFATYRDELEKKTAAGLNVAVELEEGRLLVEATRDHVKEQGNEELAASLTALAKALKAPSAREKYKQTSHDAERIAVLLSEPTWSVMQAADARAFAVRTEAYRIDVERRAARFSSWYELFPRSQSGDVNRHGSFDDVIKRLPAIRDMGFDTLYFPPIHPIGKKHRKGKNNSLTAASGEPGSPYAIGAEEGGHDAIHPELGTIEDFRRLRDEAARHGLELALDFAIQCSPDHPWLKAHPDWFSWRPDGSIRYAENPPKKYQDIVNVDFYADGAMPVLWIALRDVVLFWIKEGVRVFRVDNPHTKPLPFWEWLITDIRGRFPDVIFLSEAFTRPKMMYRLAKLGYSQSYTYFTWRHTKAEFIDYMTELTTSNVREYFRPHFFVNTPDINPYFLQRSGRPGFLIRAALATTLSGLWGMYSGFELCEGTPVPGKEEYLDSEKYEIRAWDWHRPGHIIREITQLNRIRRENPALQSHLGLRFLHASSDHILYFLKTSEPSEAGQRFGDNIVLVAINLDPHHTHEAAIEIPLWEFGVPDEGAIDVEDLLHGGCVTWQGKWQHVRLDPMSNPYAIWRIRHRG